jgi:hypothetical protein
VAHRAGVHAERAADAAGDAFEKFEAREAVALGFDGDSFEARASAATEAAAGDFDAAEGGLVKREDEAAVAAVFDEEI